MKAAFKAAYKHAAEAVYFSPGRVNLIGEHTDYNGGFVFPCALNFGCYLLIAPNTDNIMRFRSFNITTEYEIKIEALTTKLPDKAWVNYPLGVIAQFIKAGKTPNIGYDMLFWGNVPAGAGLSSSAAMEVVTAFAFNELLETNYDRTELAKIGQAAEHEFAGVMCGIMDQFASAWGKKDHAIFLNCDTMQFEYVPVQLKGIKVVMANSHSPHHLDSGAYNQRVAECKLAVKQILKVRPIRNLAELTIEQFNEIEDSITDITARFRARHVVGEISRTVDAITALRKGDIERLGCLMTGSHVSLRDNYEVTGKELDTLAAAAWQIPGVLGSRMTGGGFGGCTVSLVHDEAIDLFIEQVGKTYTAMTGLKADFYVAEIGDGAHRVE